jgi:hypothetical protein
MKKVFLFGIAIMFLTVGFVFAQPEVDISINLQEGSINQKSNYDSITSVDGNNYIQDQYSSHLHGIHVYNTTYNHSFTPQSFNTKITGGSTFGVPGLRYEEILSTTQVDVNGKDCCAVGAGSAISVFGVNQYATTGSQGGTGACCGVNYNATAEEGAGTVKFGYVENKIGEDVVPSAEEGGPDTTLYGNTQYKYKVQFNGNYWANFSANVVAPECSPDAPADPITNSVLKICPWDMGPEPTLLP